MSFDASLLEIKIASEAYQIDDYIDMLEVYVNEYMIST